MRERIRCEVGGQSARGEKTAIIAKDLRVSERSVERWRHLRERGIRTCFSVGHAITEPVRRAVRRWPSRPA
ncbi:helix-turn-helix domain-containing protein [Streptomyces fildesensis]|uniref:helix-turn-helix domain-containing protein n=1 Tax=Streptomyces fildesensis TaxID=375757 RepID=UPI002F3597C3